MERERDDQVDRLLRRVFKSDPAVAPAEDCPDAEVLGAWVDGRLTGAMQSAALSHLSICPRCQAIVAELSRMQPAAAAPSAWWQRGLRVRWLVPVTAAAAAIVIWFAVPRTPPSVTEFAPVREAASRAEPEAAAPAAAPPAPAQEPAPPAPLAAAPATAAPAAAPLQDAPRAESFARQRQAPAAPVADSPASVGAAPPSRDERADAADTARNAEARRLGAVQARKEVPEADAARQGVNEPAVVAERRAAQGLVVAAPDRSTRWRVERDGTIARTLDGGSTWEPLVGNPSMDVVAGASPSPAVCWLVGRAGAVLLTLDGRRFTRVPFPDSGDLAAVQATDGRTAQVTTSGGRIFRTIDGGQTWVETRPQDF
jgi:hypothetical protein